MPFSGDRVYVAALEMNLETPKRIATTGAVLISVSGVVNAVLGARTGAILYDAYPGGRMGHVGIIAGVSAIAIGLVIAFIVVPLYEHKRQVLILFGGILTVTLGHVGAIAGAIYIGTAGVVLCYISGIWVIVAAAKELRAGKS